VKQLRKYLCFGLILLNLAQSNRLMAQKVGVVLSGGGSDGLAHIGVLKVLEENNIPIDYICGTSIGALIGALYSVGYTPSEIEQLYQSAKFKNWANGEIEDRYTYSFKKKENDASWVSLKFSPDTFILTSLPTHIISPLPLDFALMEMFAKPNAVAKNNFDSLMIPFRCVASDITLKCEAVMGQGDLGQSILASMSYPFYLKPVVIGNSLYVDGGLYNNFPVDVMQNYFMPDIIIGSNVSENINPPDEDNLISQVKSMLVNRDPAKILPDNAIVISPKTGISGLFNFNDPDPIITEGSRAANEKIEEIKTRITRRTNVSQLEKTRKTFMAKAPDVVFSELEILGLNKPQSQYVRKLLGLKNKSISLEKIKPYYFRLAGDPKFSQVSAQAELLADEKNYVLKLRVKKEKTLFASFGGNFSSRPVNAAYIGVQYNYLRRIGLTIYGNSYFGKLYGSYQVKGRFDFPFKYPFYLETSFTRNRWDFFRSSTAFFEESKPSYLLQNENTADLNFGFPMGNKGKLVAGGAASNLFDRYYQTNTFSQNDTTDRTDFILLTPYLSYERNTLNRKQFANSGSYLCLRLRYVYGNEITNPGTTSPNELFFTKFHDWTSVRMIYENYFVKSGPVRLGYYMEGVWSDQSFFNNYTATILASPSFNPIPESRTLFLETFRAHSWSAFGVRSVFVLLKKNVDLRFEGYIYQPYKEILRNENFRPYYGPAFSKRYFIGSGSLVFNSPVGPLSLNINYYQGKEKPISFLFTFGYLIFNKRVLE
jgi:NTE family protein